jgi:putative lipoic acid-binding regulatory protein
MFAIGFQFRAVGLFRVLPKNVRGACLCGIPRHSSDAKHEHGAGFATSPKNGIGAQGPSVDAQSKQQKLHDLIGSYQQSSAAQPAVDRKVLRQVLDNTAAIASNCNSNKDATGAKSVFADTMQFPTDFMLKVVGLNEPTFAADIVKLVTTRIGPQKVASLSLSTKETAGGKYVSVSIKPLFRSAEELYAVYDAVKQDARVKFML